MLSIEELEKKWLIYKLKSYIPHAIIVTSLMIISAIIFIVIDDSKTDTPIKKIEKVELKSKNNSVNSAQTTLNKTPKKEPEKVVTTQKDKTKREEPEKVVIAPSLNFMQEIEKDSKKRVIKKPVSKNKTTQKVSKVTTKSDTKPIVLEEEKKKITINIANENTQKEIEDVISRFKRTNSPVLSLFIAKKYYEAGNYKMAYNYALVTNGIDNEIETSWLIFAKSLVKLNQKDKAIKTLKEYINHSHSNRAKTLLNEIIAGKMK